MNREYLLNFLKQNDSIIQKNLILEKKQLQSKSPFLLKPLLKFFSNKLVKKKIYLFNDTSITSHTGCLAVMNCLNFQLKNFQVTRHYCGETIIDDEKFEQADCIIINGEGTIHSNNAKSIFLMNVAKKAILMKKKIALINFSYFNMSSSFDEVLKKVDYLSVRDLFSYNFLKKKFHVELNFDLSICKNFIFDEITNDANYTALNYNEIVGDSVFKKLEIKSEKSFFSLDLLNCSLPKSFFIKIIKDVRIHITGRFHSVILSGLAGSRFLAFSSNTPKIESIIEWSKIPIPIINHSKEFEKKYRYAIENPSIYNEFKSFLNSQKKFSLEEKINI